MSIFVYEATDKDGAIRKGEYSAPSKGAVLEHLEREDLIPVVIEEKRTGALGLNLSLFESVDAVDRMVLARNLAAMVRAGLSLAESLDILIADAAKNIMRVVLTTAKTNLQSGQPLSATFAMYTQHFPPVFVGMLRVGEASGQLDRILEELAKFIAKEHNLTRRVRSALAYPVVLIVASTLVVTLLITFILPRLAKTFQQTGAELPLITRALVGVSDVITYSPLLDLGLLIFAVWFFIFFRRTAIGKRFFFRVVLKIPVAKELVKKVAIVRFSRTLGNLVAGGISIVEALDLAAESAGNESYKQAILDSKEQVKGGVPISQALGKHENLFPRLFVSMLAVGEKTGTMDNILKTLADFYEDEVDDALKNLITVIEPVLLLFMGLVVGLIAVSILAPIYQLVGKFV
jgi:type II secretory pathway component PulF